MRALVFAAGSLSVAQAAKDKDIIKMFKKSGCNECHTILSFDVTVQRKKDAEPVEKKDEDEPDPPDLSGTGLERDAKWISNYLRKKEEIDGRKHEKLFKGSTEDRRAIAMWLADQKTKPEDLPKPKTNAEAESDKKEDGGE